MWSYLATDVCKHWSLQNILRNIDLILGPGKLSTDEWHDLSLNYMKKRKYTRIQCGKHRCQREGNCELLAFRDTTKDTCSICWKKQRSCFGRQSTNSVWTDYTWPRFMSLSVFYLWSRTAMAIETKHPLSCWKIQFIVQHHTIIIHPPPSGTTNIYFKFELLLLWLTSVFSRRQAGRTDTQKTSMSALWSNRWLTKLGTHLHQHT